MSKTSAENGAKSRLQSRPHKRWPSSSGKAWSRTRVKLASSSFCESRRGASVTERAVPVAIFTGRREDKREYLQKWLKDGTQRTSIS